MKTVFLCIVSLLFVSCFQKTNDEVFQEALEESCEDTFQVYDEVITKEAECYDKRERFMPYMIHWKSVGKLPLYTDFVHSYISRHESNDSITKKIKHSNWLYHELEKLKNTPDKNKVKRELNRLISYIIEEKDAFDKKLNLPKNVYTNAGLCGISSDFLYYYHYTMDMSGEENPYNSVKPYDIFTLVFRPKLNSDKFITSEIETDFYSNKLTIKDVASILSDKLKGKATPHLFRIKFSYRAVSEQDIELLTAYIRNNPDDCDAKYIYVAYELQEAMYNGDKKRWKSAAEYMYNHRKKHFGPDAALLIKRILNRRFVFVH